MAGLIKALYTDGSGVKREVPVKCGQDGSLIAEPSAGSELLVTTLVEVAVGPGATEILSPTPIEFLLWPNIWCYIHNEGGGSGDPFTDAWIEVSPDTSDPTWWVNLSAGESAVEQQADSLTANQTGVVMALGGAAVRFIRIMATCGLGNDSTALAWIQANRP